MALAGGSGLDARCCWRSSGLVPASDVAVALVNRVITRTVGARCLPGLELREGVPADQRTIIVVPTMLADLADNPQTGRAAGGSLPLQLRRELFFALLSDWRDSTRSMIPDDDALLAEAAAGIATLNDRYPRADGSMRVFSFFIGDVSGMQAKENGSAGSASAASCMS